MFHQVVAYLIERDSGDVLTETLLFTTGLLVSFLALPGGVRYGTHQQVPARDISLVAARLEKVADEINAVGVSTATYTTSLPRTTRT